LSADEVNGVPELSGVGDAGALFGAWLALVAFGLEEQEPTTVNQDDKIRFAPGSMRPVGHGAVEGEPAAPAHLLEDEFVERGLPAVRRASDLVQGTLSVKAPPQKLGQVV